MDHLYDTHRYVLGALSMGCDIHLCSEIKKDGVWMVEEEDLNGTGRNYQLFGLLASVRTNWPWSFKAKGMPEDCSDTVRDLSDCIGWHSHSYLTVQDLTEKAATMLLVSDDKAADLLHMLTKFIESLGPTTVPATDRRIVFWFDN